MGKGDKRRPFDTKLWDKNWVLIFGKDCNNCQGTGKVRVVDEHKGPGVGWRFEDCPFCNGLGRKEK